MVVVRAVGLISVFCSHLECLCDVSSNTNGKKNIKTCPYGGDSFSNNVLSHFKTCTCFVLSDIAHLCIEFDCVSNKYGKFFIKFV